jgi:hypothetical protein
MNRQKGLSMTALLVGCVVLALVALVGMKVGPAYLEYAQIRKAVAAIVQGGDAQGSVIDIRKAFDRRATVDDLTSISAQDLDISKDQGAVVISFAYSKKIALFSNVSLLIEFSGSSKK